MVNQRHSWENRRRRTDPTTPGVWQGGQESTNCYVAGATWHQAKWGLILVPLTTAVDAVPLGPQGGQVEVTVVQTSVCLNTDCSEGGTSTTVFHPFSSLHLINAGMALYDLALTVPEVFQDFCPARLQTCPVWRSPDHPWSLPGLVPCQATNLSCMTKPRVSLKSFRTCALPGYKPVEWPYTLPAA